jgi:CRISPR system Cascade subunit CasB
MSSDSLPEPAPDAPASDAPARAESRLSVVGRIAAALDVAKRPDLAGRVAELRRLDPHSPGGPAFWRVAAEHLVPAGELSGDGPARDARERRWAVILGAMAHLGGLHDPHVPLGRALADASVSEARVLRLLRARDEALWDQLRAMVHQLASRAVRADQREIAALVLSDAPHDDAWREDVRRKVARHYYAALTQTNQGETP